MRYHAYASVAAVLASVSIGSCDPCNEIREHGLSAQPNPGGVAEEVVVTDRSRLALDASPVSLEFDLDGDGRFETPARLERLVGPNVWTATVRKSYDAPATIRVASLLRTTGPGGFDGFDTRGEILEIKPAEPTANQPPLASFTMSPNPAAPEDTITYDASASMDPDGQVVRYEWDLNNDGTFERDEGSNPVFTKLDEGFTATYTIGLRVTDDDGDTATTTGQLVVQNKRARLAGPRKMAQRSSGGRTFEFPPQLHSIDPGEVMLNGTELILLGRTDRGQIPASPFPASLRHGNRKVRWVSTADATVDSTTSEGNGRGFALLAFPAGGRACMAFKVAAPAEGNAAGSFRILGGVGRARGLRGKGSGTGKLTRDGVSLRGRLHVGFGGKKHFQLGRSGCAPLIHL